MLDNVDNIHHFIDSTWRLCAHLGSWVSGLISKPNKKVVGSISRLAEERGNCYLDSMDIAYIDISSSDDELEIIDPGRILPRWAASERNSDSRRANGNTSQHQTVNSRISNSHGTDYEKMSSQQALKRTLPSSFQPGPSNGNTSQHQTVNSRISNYHGTDYEKMSSQQAFKRTLPSSFQSSETRAFPPSSFAPNNRVSYLSSSQLHDAYRSRHHGVGPSTSGEKGFFRDNFGRGNDGDRFMNQNGGTRALPPSLMTGKTITPPFASFSESAYRSGVGDERAPETDERLIYEAALQDISQPLKEADLPAGIMAVPLMRHQKIALAWMLQRENRSLHCLGGILADDQGLGKTISTIALILMQRQLQIKWKTDDTCNHKAEALNLDDDDDNGSIDVEKLKNDEESNDTKPIIEPSSSTRAPSRKRPAAGTLVVCPASVLRQWARELEEKVGDEKLSVLIFHGGSRTKDPVELAKYDVVLTTYSLVTNEVPKQPIVEDDDIDEKEGENFGLSSDFSVKKKRKKTYNGSKKGKKGKKGIDGSSFDSASGALAKVGWFRVILDEAQTIKNHRTQMARACSSLRAKRRWCLSGTPIQNTIDDLYSYFRFLKYDPYTVYKSFYNTIKVPISRNSIHGYKKLQAVLRAIMLRRTKGTLLDGKPIITLPPKTINLSKVDFSNEERAFYKKLEADSRSQFKAYAAAGTVNQNYANILLMLLRLRQACDHPLLVKEYNSDPVGKDSVEMAKRLPKEMLINLFNSLETTAAICCVCSDPPDDAVISMCGHVFCYQCVSEHLTGDDNMCPANHCKEQIGEDLVFSKATLGSCISDDLSGSSSGNSSFVDYSIVQNSDYSSSKIKAVLEVLQSSCRLKANSGNRDSPPSDDSDIEDFDPDVKVTKVTRNYSECTTGGPLKAIIFSQWTTMLDLVETSMQQSGIKYRRLDGRMTLTARDRAVKDFNTDPEITVMLMSLKAGNLGLNMVAACHVILLDLWWNPTTEDQAIDRAHRIGQTRPVTVTRITIKDTVEDRILALQDEKRKIVASAFGGDLAGDYGIRLTVDDLRYLFMV
ncbi:Helicase-like transcription factor chr28 [Lathyrus oleraceus]|uniref:Helicase-like transcription factor chr28 n=1 Tax=Pisum sativum TaxID=3888 RepID=A0A9D4WFH3_PEA|nr:Helicase-like transcription factor chr28 [Pisum sativum]